MIRRAALLPALLLLPLAACSGDVTRPAMAFAWERLASSGGTFDAPAVTVGADAGTVAVVGEMTLAAPCFGLRADETREDRTLRLRVTVRTLAASCADERLAVRYRTLHREVEAGTWRVLVEHDREDDDAPAVVVADRTVTVR